MFKLLLFGLLVTAINADAAFAQDVRYNFDKGTSFAQFKSYKWVVLKGATPVSDLVDKQIKAAVDVELAKKGLTRSEGETADLYIGYQAAIDTEKEYTSYDTGWGYGPGWGYGGWYGGGGGMTTGTTPRIYCGRLALGMDAASPKPPGLRPVPSETTAPAATQ